MEKSWLDEIENSLHDLTDKQATRTLQFLFWRAYENDDLEFYDLLKTAIEYGSRK